MTIRGARFSSSYDLCTLESELADISPDLLPSHSPPYGELRAFTLVFEMPMHIIVDGAEQAGQLTFSLDYPEATPLYGSLELTLTFGSHTFIVKAQDDWTENALIKIKSCSSSKTLIPKCCFTCAFSDYNPAGGPLACFRDNKTAYLRMERSKPTIFAISDTRTEEVHETYLLSRIPSVGNPVLAGDG